MEKLIRLFKIIILIIIIFQSCSTNKSLIYRIPIEMEKEIFVEIEKFDKKNLFFIMGFEDSNIIKITLVDLNNLTKNNFGFLKIVNSNRKIRIDNKLYYLVFESDRKFGTIIENQKKIQSIKERELLYDTYQEDKIQGIRTLFTKYYYTILFKFKDNKLIEKL